MLDCTTPRGQAFIAQQRAIADAIAGARGVDVIHLAPDGASPIDALFVRADRLVAIAEIKSRTLTFEALLGFDSYLVTFDKLCHGRDLAARLEVPYVLIVGLLDAIVWWRISDARGLWLVELSTRETDTQATCNGGSAQRMNAYVSLRTMEVINTKGAP